MHAKHHILLIYPALFGRHVRTGFLQSIPSSSIDSWARLKDTVPLEA